MYMKPVLSMNSLRRVPKMTPPYLPHAPEGATYVALKELSIIEPAPVVMGMDSPSRHGPTEHPISLETLTGPRVAHMTQSEPIRIFHWGFCMNVGVKCCLSAAGAAKQGIHESGAGGGHSPTTCRAPVCRRS